jgi:hypothetical protein
MNGTEHDLNLSTVKILNVRKKVQNDEVSDCDGNDEEVWGVKTERQ